MPKLICGPVFGTCSSYTRPYCNDIGHCQEDDGELYSGRYKNYNKQSEPLSALAIFLIIICFFICAFFSYRITMRLIEGCQDGDMFSCFILFKK